MDATGSASILIVAGDLADQLGRIVAALDDQSLPYSRYEAIFLDPESSDGTSERLRDLAERRPNVRVQATEEAGLRAGVEAAHGEFVLCLGPDDVLFPDGLATLLDVAADGHDIVLAGGRESGPVGFLPSSIAGTGPIDSGAPDAAIAALAPFALIRRDALLRQLSAGPQTASYRRVRVALLNAGGSVATCADPVGLGTGPSVDESDQETWDDVSGAVQLIAGQDAAARFVAAHATATLERAGGSNLAPAIGDQLLDLVSVQWQHRDPDRLPYAQRKVVRALVDRDLEAAAAAAQSAARISLAAASTTAGWSGGVLDLEVDGTIPGLTADDGAMAEGPDVRLAVRQVQTSLCYDLPTRTKLDHAPDGSTRFVAHAELDVARAAAGGPLDQGDWQVLVGLTGIGSDRAITAAAPHCRVPGAVIDGTPISGFSRDGEFHLDVGARRHGLLAAPNPPGQATVEESARGALLTITAPDLVVRGPAELPSVLYLGDFALPAVFRAADTGARLECYVSGLAGVSRLSAKIAGAKRQHLGLQLRIGPAG
ncbi:MAG: glycosyltransferase family 2 protein, partial [Microlunatus sp.]|nr:glycosyltransferase family 2 protein [Microlunatus sp.]